MKERFYSNGKLLITGEYLVLEGAKSLALPTVLGQDLCVSTSDNPGIRWKSFDHQDQIWFETDLRYDEIISGGDPENREIRNMLINILHSAYIQNPQFVIEKKNLMIETHLDFDRSWGLGTSSNYKKRELVSQATIEMINQLTQSISTTEDFDKFCSDLEQHEEIISKALGVVTIKKQLFQGFQGTIKSLGGWGGDFILAAARENPTHYFQSKGYETILPYSELILE